MIVSGPLATCAGLRHGFLTRQGGLSTGLYDALNCGFGTEDDPALIRGNRRIALARAGLSDAKLHSAYQVHSAKAAIVTAADDPDQRREVDGLVTNQPGIALGILTADCAPILFADSERGIIGAAHAGWKGALGGIAEATIAAMENLGARRGAILAAIGPCIQQSSYEVGPEFPAPFIAQDPENRRFFTTGGACRQFQFDLSGYLLHRLEKAGIGAIDRLPEDTYAEETLFFSYRRKTKRGEKDYGRQISIIGLDP